MSCTGRRLVITTLLSLATAASAPLAAQTVSGVLTLPDALRIARERNPQLQITQNDVAVAASSVRTARAAFLPNLSSSLSFGGSFSSAVTGQDDFGRPVTLPDPRTFRSSSTNQGISTGMTLFDGGQNLRNLRAQRAAFDGVEARVESAVRQLDAQVAREYYQAVRAVRNITLEEQLLASAVDRLARTEELLRLAARNRGDVLGAREDVLTSEQNVARVRGEAERARVVLAATIGLEPASTFSLDSVLPAAFDPADLDVARLVAGALKGHPLVRQREAALAAAVQRRSAARARRLPTVNASAGYSRSMSLSSYRAFGELNPQNYGYSFGMSVSLPIFTRLQATDQIVQADAAERDAEFELRSTRLAVERDVRAAVIDLVNAYQSLQLAQQRVALARERQDLTLEQYRLGGGDFAALQNIIDRTAQAERQALDARFTFISARIALEERLGAPLER